MFRPPPEPADADGLLAEAIVYRARREAFVWANDHTLAFGVVSVLTGAAAAGGASFFSRGLVALIVTGVLGLILGLFVFFVYEVIYRAPRQKLALALDRIGELVTAQERSQGIPGHELVAFEQLVDRARFLEDKWRMEIPAHATMLEADSAFNAWCGDALSMFARLGAPVLDYTEFRHLTPLKHDTNRGGTSFLEAAAEDMAERREWLMRWMKALQRERST